MKTAIWIVLFIILGVSVYYSLLSNPVAINLFNELAFTPNGWILEITSYYETINTEGWYLVSRQDTSHLTTMVIVENTQHLITQDSLLEPLRIDQNGDSLRLYSPNSGGQWAI